ncbi:1,4-alpha-glucan branching protein GlgB [uncultured Ruminococcus sp.]|uniref:1,4-alpha-glucan branching protein GlgB n=1 Tax=uncultured Ruminococcus sp. TaxID=165186 RepID=UPI002622A2F6|nr:1,4-alpha-glucan branching protein GlgB [uncultured Ruminococcus sp.]
MKNDIITEFINGQSCRAYEALGAVKTDKGIRFSTYAPHARNVELCLNGDILPMERDQRGVWTTVCAAKEGDIYQYVITTPTLEKHYRSDPFAVYSEVRPQNASVVYDIDSYCWNDDEWLSKRDKCYEKPMNIYEVHFGSWRIKEGKEETERFYTYEEMIDLLIPYVKEMGYTHIELLPLTEYPFDGSWGYQVSGYFSATSRYGDPRGLMKFIDACHEEDIGVILDFVPVHFVRDFYALHIYDGGFLFESDNEYDRYSEWGTALFDYSKPHVLSFVKSSVNFWIEKYHVDGLRYDAVANLIYRHGHTDDAVNDSGIWFLKNTNYTIQKMHPDVMLFAEDSTNYTKVTAPVEFGGLGFDYKWDLGFMNDTIDYIKTPPYERRNHHNKMTFSMSYFYNDLFILPYSHDEVVHGKKTMVDKVFGSQQEQFATIRTLYTFQFTHPGKKLNFMGNELGEYLEWRDEKELGWNLLTYPIHDSLHEYVKTLHKLYLEQPALYKSDYNSTSFRWIDADNKNQSIYAFRRSDPSGKTLYMVFNFSGSYQNYSLSVEQNGAYKELLNSDRDIYSGSNCINSGLYTTNYRLPLRLAPLSSVIIAAE